MQRHGMTMLELLVATAIFAIVMALVIEALTSVRHFSKASSSFESLLEESDRLMGIIIGDLANSAWFVNPGTDLSELATDEDYDRQQARYYPYVVIQDYSSDFGLDGMPNKSSSHWYHGFLRDQADLVRPSHLNAVKDAIPPAHQLPSQELIFLKVANGATVSDPIDHEDEWINFNIDAVPLEDYNDPSVLPHAENLMVVAAGTEGVTDVPLNWETYTGGQPWAADLDGDGINDPDPDEMREFSYCLVPDAVTGARLERRFRNGAASAVEVDAVLSRNVDRFAIDTYRTSADLAVNQVRIRLWLSSRGEDGRTLTHYTETTVALRSTVDPEYALRLADWLGDAGDFGF